MNKKLITAIITGIILILIGIHFLPISSSTSTNNNDGKQIETASSDTLRAMENKPPAVPLVSQPDKEKPLPADGNNSSAGEYNRPPDDMLSPTETERRKPVTDNLPPPLQKNDNPEKQPTKRPTRPPDMDKPQPPATLLEQINGFVAESKRTAGPQADLLGEQLLNSTNALLQVAGMAVLAENNILTEESIKQISENEDLSVPVNSLGWLFDTGHSDYAETLNSALGSRSISTDDALELIASGKLNSSGARVILDMISDDLTQEEAKAIYKDISVDDSYEYSVRMKALLKLKNEMEFADFRDTVRNVQNNIADNDAVWKEGVSRLAEKLDGPVAVHTGPPTLTPSNIDEMLAREYPMTLEDLAQKLEYIAANENSYVQQGTAKRLNNRIQQLEERPWTDAQQISLARIKTVAEHLSDLEKADTEAPSNLSIPPPGAEKEE
jgi:hypothetical protein